MATSYQHSICSGIDTRGKIDPMKHEPYNWICHLRIQADDGIHVGTGFKIHIPNANSMIILTCGHCLHFDGKIASEIIVDIGGKRHTATSNNFLVPTGYCTHIPGHFDYNRWIPDKYVYNNNYDYGVISLPGDSNEGFGWSTIIPDKELQGRLVSICGYPGDKPAGTMWITGGEITKVNPKTLSYMIDTFGGQSGSPVYTWWKGYWTVVGVHGHGGCPNSARRFMTDMLDHIIDKASLKMQSIYINQRIIRFWLKPDQVPSSIVDATIESKAVTQSGLYLRMNDYTAQVYLDSSPQNFVIRKQSGPRGIFYSIRLGAMEYQVQNN